MAVTLGAEVALPLHLDEAVTYGQLEVALIEAGFTNYTIMRTVNPDGSGDAQLYVRSSMDSNGMQQALPAADTLQKLANALGDLAPDTTEPEADENA